MFFTFFNMIFWGISVVLDSRDLLEPNTREREGGDDMQQKAQPDGCCSVWNVFYLYANQLSFVMYFTIL